MNAIKTFFADLHADEDGAAFLEYTVLLGIILAVSIAVIFSIGTWAGSIWSLLCSQISATSLGVAPTNC